MHCSSLRLARELHWPEDLGWLSPGERQRHEGFGSARRRATFLAGRWLLREMLGPGASVDVDPEGRTLWPCGHANLSHSDPWLFAAVSSQPVGVDLECLRPRSDLLDLAAQVHGRTQCAGLAALKGDAQLRYFYELWTLKEAWLKCRGSGLDFARMRELAYVEAGPGEPAQAFSRVDEARGLVLAIDGGSGPPPGEAWRRWRYASGNQSTPKSK